MKLFRFPAAEIEDTEFAKFPVDAQPVVSNPNSFAFERATDTTLSLKERVG